MSLQANNFQQVLSRVDQLAAKLGVAAGYIWTIYVRQARVEAITDGISALALAALAFAAVRLVIKWGKEKDDEHDFAVAGLAGVVVFATISASVLVYTALQAVLNPQYWAFQQMMQDLKRIM